MCVCLCLCMGVCVYVFVCVCVGVCVCVSNEERKRDIIKNMIKCVCLRLWRVTVVGDIGCLSKASKGSAWLRSPSCEPHPHPDVEPPISYPARARLLRRKKQFLNQRANLYLCCRNLKGKL